MKRLIREVKSAGNIILFLDEVHTMIGAGGAEGAIDASNILKPSLARGELQLIGATTIVEYRKYIEKDAALERRFQPITVEEPTNEQCERILEGIKGKYESHHHVTIEEGALKAAVTLSSRYINDRHLPDKAIDVLDEACSKVSLAGFKVPDSLTRLEQTLQEISLEKEEKIKNGDFAEASLLHKEQESVGKKLESVKRRFHSNNAKRNLVVTEADIESVVSSWTKIPVQKLAETESARLKKLEQTLHKRVIGQEEAVSAVARAVKRGRVGLKDPRRPIGSFLFLGPTGVGKTTMIKLLMRFYDVNGGSIKIDGHDVRDFNRSELREMFGMVLQDTWLFHGTISDNIRYGKLNATEEEVIQAAKAAHVHRFIQTLPGGYNMELNEEASNVSQGQKQLLTIARAILADPKILILDEATSSVDTRTEEMIQKAMDNLMKGRTSFVIAHRLSTIRDADLILVMKDGDIIEQGNHEELLTRGGFYADLYNSQFESTTEIA